MESALRVNRFSPFLVCWKGLRSRVLTTLCGGAVGNATTFSVIKNKSSDGTRARLGSISQRWGSKSTKEKIMKWNWEPIMHFDWWHIKICFSLILHCQGWLSEKILTTFSYPPINFRAFLNKVHEGPTLLILLRSLLQITFRSWHFQQVLSSGKE